MKSYSLSHLADHTLLGDLAALVAKDRATLASLLAHLAEVDARKLYLPAAYPSMYSYCVHELHLSEDSAFKRIRAARAGRRFPAIFPALADGRLHLSGVVLLAPHLTLRNADELLALATHRSKTEIEQLLAERFPRPEILGLVEVFPTSEVGVASLAALGRVVTSDGQLAPGPVESPSGQPDPGPVHAPAEQLAPGPVESSAPGRVGAIYLRAKLAPVAPRRFALQVTMSQELRDKLEYAQQLLSHKVPTGDIAAVLEQVLDVALPRLEKRKFAATERPRPDSRRPTSIGRYVPAHVKRAVWERDGGRCTFVSEAGCRCEARELLEFDHVHEVARGGRATVAGMRLRCRAHNQLGAERTFGVEFMRHKRRAARGAAAAGAGVATPSPAMGHPSPLVRAKAEEVIPWLRALGFGLDEARRAAAYCEAIPETSLEQRVRTALSHLAPRAACLGKIAAG